MSPVASPVTGSRRKLDEIAGTTKAVVEESGLVTSRGPVDALVSTYSVLNYGLTLRSLIDRHLHADVVVAKNLYLLWNITVDDAIDRDGSTRELLDSVAVLEGEQLAHHSVASNLLQQLLARARAFDGDQAPLTVALWEVMTAMRYEHACRAHPAMAEPERFLRHAIDTFSLEVHLAIDLLASGNPLDDLGVIGASSVYRELSAALRYANDLGGLEREREEGAVNVIAAWRRANPRSDRKTLKARAKRRVRTHMMRAHQLASTVAVPGIFDVVRTVQQILGAFSAGDAFGDPSVFTSPAARERHSA